MMKSAVSSASRVARPYRWSCEVEILRASGFNSTSSLVQDHPVMIVERGLPLCLQESCDPVLVLSWHPTSLVASISPRRTAFGILLPPARDGRHIH